MLCAIILSELRLWLDTAIARPLLPNIEKRYHLLSLSQNYCRNFPASGLGRASLREKLPFESHLAFQNLPATAFPPFNRNLPSVQSAFTADFRCSSIPMRRLVELAEVETGANQRPL